MIEYFRQLWSLRDVSLSQFVSEFHEFNELSPNKIIFKIIAF